MGTDYDHYMAVACEQASYGQYFDRMACEGSPSQQEDLAEVMGKAQNPEGQDTRKSQTKGNRRVMYSAQ